MARLDNQKTLNKLKGLLVMFTKSVISNLFFLMIIVKNIKLFITWGII